MRFRSLAGNFHILLILSPRHGVRGGGGSLQASTSPSEGSWVYYPAPEVVGYWRESNFKPRRVHSGKYLHVSKISIMSKNAFNSKSSV